MKRGRNILIVISCLAIAIFCFCVTQLNKEITIQTSTGISNKSIGWGLKRATNHMQPDLGSQNKNLLESYSGIAMGNSTDKVVYLTFDEGYEAGYTEKILEVLKANNVKACFFITAHYLNSKPELVQKMIDEGHTIRKPHCKPLFFTNFIR